MNYSRSLPSFAADDFAEPGISHKAYLTLFFALGAALVSLCVSGALVAFVGRFVASLAEVISHAK